MDMYSTTEMHTAGHVVRIIETGYPLIPGSTISQKINYLKKELDYKRKLLMLEPRGHLEMFGVLLVPPVMPSADIGAIFLHNEGYPSMCGHVIISLGRYIVEKGLIKQAISPETIVNIECPCGLVETRVQYDGEKTGAVRFFSVPSFLYDRDITVDVPGYGTITADIAFGGAFYALVHASQYNLDMKSSVDKISGAAAATTDILRKVLKITHPENSELAYLYGTIVTDGKDEYSDEVTVNCCVYNDKVVDRSPCGSGVTARIAQQFVRKFLALGQTRTFEGMAGGRFKAKPVREVKYGDYNAVIVEVSGHGYFTGTSTFSIEEEDDVGKGFLLNR